MRVLALDGADVVLITVGPFFRFGVPILRAAIDAGCSYLDICDDWEPITPMLDLDVPARSAGVTALVGVGASPGITNLLAVLAARQLDTVTEIVTGWSIDAAPPEATVDGSPSAAMVHGIQQITGTAGPSTNARYVRSSSTIPASAGEPRGPSVTRRPSRSRACSRTPAASTSPSAVQA